MTEAPWWVRAPATLINRLFPQKQSPQETAERERWSAVQQKKAAQLQTTGAVELLREIFAERSISPDEQPPTYPFHDTQFIWNRHPLGPASNVIGTNEVWLEAGVLNPETLEVKGKTTFFLSPASWQDKNVLRQSLQRAVDEPLEGFKYSNRPQSQ